MSLKRYNGSAFADVSLNRRYNGSAWQDCDFLRKWNGSAWVDVWTAQYFITNGLSGDGTTASASGGIWTAHVVSSSYVNAGALLQLFPAKAFAPPFNLEIDWEGTISAGIAGYLEIGSFDNMGTYLGGSGIQHYTSSFSRIIETVTVPTITGQEHFGAHVNLDRVGGYSATLIVYGIKINGINIPIR